jgi:hypothetical protein
MKSNTALRNRIVWLALLALALALALAWPAVASGGEVTRGALQTYATGLERGYAITGHVVMVRTGSEMTLVSVHAAGLAANTTYPVHVHNRACGDANAGGHYQHVPGGPVDAVNEIWPGFTTNAAGMGNGQAANAFRARPEAQSVVIHDTDGARIACADLLP